MSGLCSFRLALLAWIFWTVWSEDHHAPNNLRQRELQESDPLTWDPRKFQIINAIGRSYVISKKTDALLDSFKVLTAFSDGINLKIPRCKGDPPKTLPCFFPQLNFIPKPRPNAEDYKAKTDSYLQKKFINTFFPFSWEQMSKVLSGVSLRQITKTFEGSVLRNNQKSVNQYCNFQRSYETLTNGCPGVSATNILRGQVSLRLGYAGPDSHCTSPACRREIQEIIYQALNVGTITATLRLLEASCARTRTDATADGVRAKYSINSCLTAVKRLREFLNPGPAVGPPSTRSDSKSRRLQSVAPKPKVVAPRRNPILKPKSSIPPPTIQRPPLAGANDNQKTFSQDLTFKQCNNKLNGKRGLLSGRNGSTSFVMDFSNQLSLNFLSLATAGQVKDRVSLHWVMSQAMINMCRNFKLAANSVLANGYVNSRGKTVFVSSPFTPFMANVSTLDGSCSSVAVEGETIFTFMNPTPYTFITSALNYIGGISRIKIQQNQKNAIYMLATFKRWKASSSTTYPKWRKTYIGKYLTDNIIEREEGKATELKKLIKSFENVVLAKPFTTSIRFRPFDRNVVLVQDGVNWLQIDACGSAGSGSGGLGGFVSARIPVTPGSKLYVYVGGKIGLNGGGRDFFGGGGTDIRTKPGGLDGSSNRKSRLLVAGGGGGGRKKTARGVVTGKGKGGAGGGQKGGAGRSANKPYVGMGGTQKSGGKGGKPTQSNECTDSDQLGRLWEGGKCQALLANGRVGEFGKGCGGGGGYYGGGAGFLAGGGGSSWVMPRGKNVLSVQGDKRCVGNGVMYVTPIINNVPLIPASNKKKASRRIASRKAPSLRPMRRSSPVQPYIPSPRPQRRPSLQLAPSLIPFKRPSKRPSRQPFRASTRPSRSPHRVLPIAFPTPSPSPFPASSPSPLPSSSAFTPCRVNCPSPPQQAPPCGFYQTCGNGCYCGTLQTGPTMFPTQTPTTNSFSFTAGGGSPTFVPYSGSRPASSIATMPPNPMPSPKYGRQQSSPSRAPSRATQPSPPPTRSALPLTPSLSASLPLATAAPSLPSSPFQFSPFPTISLETNAPTASASAGSAAVGSNTAGSTSSLGGMGAGTVAGVVVGCVLLAAALVGLLLLRGKAGSLHNGHGQGRNSSSFDVNQVYASQRLSIEMRGYPSFEAHLSRGRSIRMSLGEGRASFRNGRHSFQHNPSLSLQRPSLSLSPPIARQKEDSVKVQSKAHARNSYKL